MRCRPVSLIRQVARTGSISKIHEDDRCACLWFFSFLLQQSSWWQKPYVELHWPSLFLIITFSYHKQKYFVCFETNMRNINKLVFLCVQNNKTLLLSCHVYCLWIPDKVCVPVLWDPAHVHLLVKESEREQFQSGYTPANLRWIATGARKCVCILTFCVFTAVAHGDSCVWTQAGRCELGGAAGSPGCSWPELWRQRASVGVCERAPAVAGRPPPGACCSNERLQGGGGVIKMLWASE